MSQQLERRRHRLLSFPSFFSLTDDLFRNLVLINVAVTDPVLQSAGFFSRIGEEGRLKPLKIVSRVKLLRIDYCSSFGLSIHFQLGNLLTYFPHKLRPTLYPVDKVTAITLSRTSVGQLLLSFPLLTV